MMLSLRMYKWFVKSFTSNLSEYLSYVETTCWVFRCFPNVRKRSTWIERHKKPGTLRNLWRILEDFDKESKEQVWKKVWVEGGGLQERWFGDEVEEKGVFAGKLVKSIQFWEV